MAKLLGLDVGEKRIGVAFCDTQVGIPFAREVFKRTTLEADYMGISALCAAEKIGKIIIGEPLGEENEPTPRSRQIHSFAVHLAKIAPEIAIEFIDESFSSKEALAQIPLKRDRKVKGADDSLAAAIILERYLKLR